MLFRVGPLIEPGTGTIVHPKKNKERLPLSVIMNNSPHSPRSPGYSSLHQYYDAGATSPRNPAVMDYSVKSGKFMYYVHLSLTTDL